MYFFRDLKKNELDFILEDQEGQLVAIEVKAKSNIQQSDLKGFRAFLNTVKQPVKNLFIFYGGKELSAMKVFDRTVYLVPSVLFA